MWTNRIKVLICIPLAAMTLFAAGCTRRPASDGASGTPSGTAASSEAPSTQPSSTQVSGHPIASRTTRWGDAKVRLEVYAIRPSGGLLVLDFGLHNLGSHPVGVGSMFSRDHVHEDASGVYLYDPAHRTEHWPAKSGGTCVCSTDLGGADPGQVMLMSATYSPPPAGVHHLDVHVPSIGVLRDVPIGN